MSAPLPKKKAKRRVASPESFSEDEHIEPPSFSLATLGLQRVGAAPPPRPQPQQPIQALNARGMPARIRKRNRFFFDDDIINDDKPLRMSLSPRKTPSKTTPLQQYQQPASPKTPTTKVLKRRKGIVTRFLRSDEKKKPTNDSNTKIDDSINDLNITPTKSTCSSVNSAHTPPRSTLMASMNHDGPTINSLQQTVDKQVGQRIGLRLRNLLKLPKAHKWVINEWFYSFIDKPLLNGDNDFQVCMSQELPLLRTRKLMRPEWVKIRSLMGKPRRCSIRFLEEERRDTERKRYRMRYIQSNRSAEYKDPDFWRDLPEKIPLSLPVGTKVTARLRTPQDGIFSGTVDAFHSQSSTYRITFDRPGMGKHSIADIDIVSENFFEMMPLQSISKEFRPSHAIGSVINVTGNLSPYRMGIRGLRSALNMNLNRSDPLLGQEAFDSPYKNPVLTRDNINGVSVKLLEHLIRLRRALAIKRTKLQRLRDMNNEAELRVPHLMGGNGGGGNSASAHNNSNSSSDESSQATTDIGTNSQLSEEFQRRYASIVISMERMNRDIQDYLYEVQTLAVELTRDPQEQAMLAPTYLREKCREDAENHVNVNNHSGLKNQTTLNLIKNLTTILVVASHLGSADCNNAQVPKVLEGCMEEVKTSLFGLNVETFQKNVQIHLHHIRLGIGQNIISANNNTLQMSHDESLNNDN